MRVAGKSVLSSISISGIAVGMAVDFVATIVVALIVGGAIIVGIFTAMFEGPPVGFETLVRSHQTVIAWGRLAGVIVAGYVAARVAGKGELINGALACGIGSVWGLLAAAFSNEVPDNEVPNEDGSGTARLISMALAPLFGMLGGGLRLWLKPARR